MRHFDIVACGRDVHDGLQVGQGPVSFHFSRRNRTQASQSAARRRAQGCNTCAPTGKLGWLTGDGYITPPCSSQLMDNPFPKRATASVFQASIASHRRDCLVYGTWAAGDACSRAVNLAYLVKKGEKGIPTVLTAKTWGFYDVLFKGKPFEFQRPYGSYIMENVLFKISFPAEFHAQTAVEAAHIVHKKLKELGKTAEDIKSVRIRTQEAAIRIIDKQGPLDNFADRDHAINYMVAYPLIFGELTSESYTDTAAADPRIDALRAKIYCVEDKKFSVDYHDPEKRSIGNALLVELNDGTVLDEVEVEYPVGHKRRRTEGTPLLMAKFQNHIAPHFDAAHQKKILDTVTNAEELSKLPVDKFTDLFVKA
ncbi:hypothetical protein NMY22_g3247 [Coprinellus aureogranulatus]|nr:hypothetical protein NMY22_g3247 [Coprinellus aureogranulatus]